MKTKLCKAISLLSNPNDESSNGIFMRDRNWYHIHIISREPDEKIEEGDWYVDYHFGDLNQAIEYEDTLGKDCHYKIIASTDKKLGLPQPSPEYKQQYFKEYNAYNVKDILVDYEAPEPVNKDHPFKKGMDKFRDKLTKLKLTNNFITIHSVEPIVYTEKDMNDFAGWYIKNTGRYSSDVIALERGDYLKLWHQNKKK